MTSSSTPPPGTEQGDEAFFPKGVIYQQYRHFIRNYESPTEKLVIPGIDQSKHGMYKSYPYYTFVEDQGQKYIVSDGRLLGRLELLPGPSFRDRKDGSGKWLVAKYKLDILRSDSGSTPSPGEMILSFNDPACGEVDGFLVTKTDPAGKDISETDRFPDLPSGNNSLSCYRLKRPTPDVSPQSDIQPWNSAFTSQDHYEPLYYLTASWSVKDLKYIDYQHQNADRSPLFALPNQVSGASKNWWKATGGLSMPWGWSYDEADYSSADTISTMISTSSDLMNALKRTAGFNVSGSVDVSYGFFASAEASFSYKSEDSTMQQFNNMHASKSVFVQSQYSHTEYAIVVNKIDLPLTDGFKEAVGFLLTDLEAGQLSDQELTDFLDAWGTHYAYAITYGSQGTGTHSLSESQMSQMVAQGVNYSQAWQANAAVKVLGDGVTIGGGSNSATDQQMQSTFASITNDSADHYICTGGASCGQGEPTGEPKIPVYLDLRPMSQLLGPPFYKTDARVVLDLRDRVHDAIQSYAFVTLPESPPSYKFLELTFQPPSYQVEKDNIDIMDLVWGDITISVDSNSQLIPRENMTHVMSDPSTLLLNLNGGLPKALLFIENEASTLSGQLSIRGFGWFNTISLQGGSGPTEVGEAGPPYVASFVPVSVSGQLTQANFELVGTTLVPRNPGEEGVFRVTMQVTTEPADLARLLGVSNS